MLIKDSKYISYTGIPVREAWLNNTLVWQSSSFNWQLRSLAKATWTDVAYGPTDTLVVVGNNRYSYSTDNGTTWASPIFDINPNVGTETYNAICYGSNNTWSLIEGIVYALSGSQYTYTSVDPVTGWTASILSASLTALYFCDVLYSTYHNKFIAIGEKQGRATNSVIGMYSTDAVNWLSANYIYHTGLPGIDSQGFTGGITEGSNMPNHRLVGSGGNGAYKFGYSDDGITWRQGRYSATNSPLGQNLQTGCTWYDVAYGYDGNATLPVSGRYVSVNFNGAASTYQFAYSDDGIGWIGVSYSLSALKQNWRSVTYGNGYFVALGRGRQAISKDGKNWIAYNNFPSNAEPTDIEVANNRFVGVLYDDAVNNVGCATAEFIF